MDVRLAHVEDIPVIEALIARSVMELMGGDYSLEQRRAPIGSLFGVDRQVVEDGTYFVVEDAGTLVGSGGWSARRTLFGGDGVGNRDASLGIPGVDAAHIRAFYVHPGAARTGIGSLILQQSEAEATARGFTGFAMGATLTGKPFYTRHGYHAGATFMFALPNGLAFPLVHMQKEATGFRASNRIIDEIVSR